MIAKINVTPIIAEHLKTLRDAGGKSILPRDVILFYAMPAAFSVIVFFSRYLPGEPFVQIGAVGVTVIVPLMLGVLFSLYSIIERLRPPEGATLNAAELARRQTSLRLLRQLHYNIMYVVIVSGISLVFLAINMADKVPFSVRRISFAFLCFIGIHVALTILMVLKRISALISYDLGEKH